MWERRVTGKDIAIKPATSPEANPSNYRNISKYINVANTSIDSWLFLNVSYGDADLTGVIESSLAMWRHNGSAWSQVNGTNGVDTAQNYVYANITNFSIFAPMGVNSNIDSCTMITSPGTYTLTQNITNSAASKCIEIISNDVVFDGAGYAIDGVDSVDTYGVYTYKSNVTVRNLTITDWNYGIYYANAVNGTIADNNLSSNNGTAIFLTASSNNNTISNNMVINNWGYGIKIRSSSNNNTISNNTARNNSDGIYLWSSSNNILTNNTLSSNGEGIFIYSSSNNNTISGNSVFNNVHFGIYLYDSNSNNTISNNTASNNSMDGIYLSYSSNNFLINNTARYNTLAGISFLHSSGNRVSNNTALSNFKWGIGISSSGSNILTDNNMTDNNYNFYLYGTEESEFNNSIYRNNTVDGKPVIYVKNVSDIEYNSSTNAGTLYCILCNNITVKDLILTRNYHGIFFWNTTNSTIENVSAILNYKGLYLEYSNNNTISNSTSVSNIESGIAIAGSRNNTMINNNASMNAGGLVMQVSDDTTLSHNVANSNSIFGIFFEASSNNILLHNSADSNVQAGVFLIYSSNFTLTNNTANNNSIYGIALDSSSNSILMNNTALNNTYYDFGSWSGSANNSIINLSIPLSISFTGKDIALKSVSSPPSDPTGYHNLSRYINATNTSSDSWLLWNVSYDESEVTNLNESSLRIWRHNGASWSLVSGTNSVDTAQNRIYANITSFSIFAPMGTGDTTPPSVTNLSVTPSMVNMGENVNITTDASDVNMNFTGVYVSVKHPGGYVNTSQMNGNGSYYYVYSNTSSEDGRYNVTVNASDVLGNFNNTQSTWFVVTTSFSANTSDNDTERGYGPRIWNRTNFPGFVDNEELGVLNVSDRLVAQNYLWYNTTTNLTQYYVNQYNASKLVENAHDQNGTKQSAGGGYYSRIGWMGTHYVAFNGKANKLAKLVLEHGTATSEKKTLVVGETWDIGDGWTLTANSINASVTPRRAWLALSKNGATLDDKVVNQLDLYNYSINNSAGENDVPIFVTYIDSVFAGATSDMVQLRYTWLSSDSVTNITAGEIFGNLVVDQSTDTLLNLTNSNNSINLSQNSTINLMDRFYFNVLNNTSLEYYPFMAPVHIDALASTNTTLDIFEKSGMAGSVNVARMKDTPPGINRSMSLTPFGKYISINANQNIAGNLSWVKIRIFYSDTELSNSNLTESSLAIVGYNESAGAWEILTTGLNTTDTTGYTGSVEINVSHFSYYGIAGTPIYTPPPAQPPCTSCGGGGSGGGGGGGTSAENYSNIESKEKRDNYIFKDKVASYKFNTTDPIMYVNITGNISAGDVTTMVEVLRNTSTLVKNISAPGLVYKNVNIWVGTSGFATPKNMKQGVVGFRVRNSWLEEKELAAGDVRLVKLNGSGWIELDTYETTKGSEHVYYEAVTDSFSPFAITAFRSDVPVEAIKTPVTAQETQAPEEIEVKREETSGLNGILLVTAVVLVIIVAILVAVYLRDKKKI